MRDARATLQASRVMLLGRKYEVVLNVAETGSEAPLADNEAAVGLARCMSARLYGEGFRIDPAGEQIRDLGASTAERWIWTVEPTREGRERRLTAESRTQAYLDGRCQGQLQLNRTASLDVEVRVPPARPVPPDPGKWMKRLTKLFNSARESLTAMAGLAAAATALVFAMRRFLASLKSSPAQA